MRRQGQAARKREWKEDEKETRRRQMTRGDKERRSEIMTRGNKCIRQEGQEGRRQDEQRSKERRINSKGRHKSRKH